LGKESDEGDVTEDLNSWGDWRGIQGKAKSGEGTETLGARGCPGHPAAANRREEKFA